MNGYEFEATKWQAVRDENSIDTNGVKIIFVQERNSYLDDVVEVSFNTSAQNCRICHGKTELDDIQFSTVGQLVFTKDREKLRQDIEKFLVTIITSNEFHPWYGTSLVDLIGRGIADYDSLRRQIINEIRTGIEKIIDLQRQQESYQVLSDAEVLLEFEDINLNFFDVDVLTVDFTVLVRDLASMKVSHLYKF